MTTILTKDLVESSSRYDTQIVRRKTHTVMVGDIAIGSEHPVRVQSMINEDTLDVEGSTAAIRRLHEIGCEIVRLTVPSLAHAKAVGEIANRLKSSYKPVPFNLKAAADISFRRLSALHAGHVLAGLSLIFCNISN